uniref:Major capsid protein N-terminal domain-containing protein n=1 Tax=viral metagenome TaxID=1070528 RepID=A0A6C0IXY4_9ZZZZ
MTAKQIILNSLDKKDSYTKNNNGDSIFNEKFMTHTNFAKNITDVYPMDTKNNYEFGDTVHFEIDQIGDLLSKITFYLEFSNIEKKCLDNFSIVPEIMHAIIKSITIRSNNTVIQKLTGHSIYIQNQLYSPKETLNISNAGFINKNTFDGEKHILYLDIPFWFTKELDKALPLLSLNYEKISIDLELNNFSNISKNLDEINFCLKNIKLIGEYINLDNDEKIRYINNPSEYIIEQIEYRDLEIEKNMSSSKKINIDKYSLVSELIWVFSKNNLENKNLYFNYWKDDVNNGNEHCRNVRVLLNGNSINSLLKSSYYRKIQRYQNHPSSSLLTKQNNLNCIYQYSFSLNPDNIKSSGFLSLNKFNSVNLDIQILPTDFKRIMRIIIKKYNILKIDNGNLYLLN